MIARAISKNRTLKHLDMTRNDIDDNGLRYNYYYNIIKGCLLLQFNQILI